jgi:hypothetical protein
VKRVLTGHTENRLRAVRSGLMLVLVRAVDHFSPSAATSSEACAALANGVFRCPGARPVCSLATLVC